MTRQAVILAAGRGHRLGAAARGRPKCLLTVGGQTLVEHQLAALAEIGIEDICVVAGYGAEDVSAHVGGRCTLVLNPRWEETNSLYSLWLAREWVRGGELFVLNSDVLAHPEVFRRVAATAGSSLAYDSSSGHEDEHMRVWVEGGELRAISKCLAAPRISGENVGLLRFERRAAPLVLGMAGALATDGHDRSWAAAAVDRLLPRLKIRCVDIADLPWVEIDYGSDLRTARQTVWPAIRDPLRSSSVAADVARAASF